MMTRWAFTAQKRWYEPGHSEPDQLTDDNFIVFMIINIARETRRIVLSQQRKYR